MFDVVATRRRCEKAVGVDSESQFLAIKNFCGHGAGVSPALAKTEFSDESRQPIRRRVSGRDDGFWIVRTNDARSRASIATFGDDELVLGDDQVAPEVTTKSHRVTTKSSRYGTLRYRASLSVYRSRPAGWPCRRTTSSPGRRTSRRAAAWLSPGQPCPDWPR